MCILLHASYKKFIFILKKIYVFIYNKLYQWLRLNTILLNYFYMIYMLMPKVL